jgi:RNA polymerase sigma factor (sigma-70 family)
MEMLHWQGTSTLAMLDPDHRAPVTLDDFLLRVEPRLKRLLASYRIPVADAEDLVQQALLALLYQWETVRDPESWLLGTLRRLCLMYWRGNRRRLDRAVDAAILEWLSEPVAAPQERADLLADLDKLIGKVPQRCRSLLRLRFRLGYDPPEVAAKLGYRASSIGKITTRCLAALSRELLASGRTRRGGNLEALSAAGSRPAARR